MDKEIVKFCLEKGLLLDQEILSLFNEIEDIDSVKLIIEKIKNSTFQRVLTKNILNENKEQINKFFFDLPYKNQKKLEKLKIKLGLSIEISRQEELSKTDLPSFEIKTPYLQNPLLKDKLEVLTESDKEENFTEIDTEGNPLILNKSLNKGFEDVKVISMDCPIINKIGVENFTNYFRNRFNEMKIILQDHPELDNLISINKIVGEKKRISLIGIVSNKNVTKNKNILFEIEDLTGKVKILVSKNKPELYKKAEEVTQDSVIGFKCSGNQEILFVNEIIFPDSVILERKKSPTEEYVLFIADLHFGSKKFLEKNFLKFIDYLNGKLQNTPEVEKIKYLFIVGDLITGVGNYPNQEDDLKIIDIEEQFIRIAELLGRIRKDIKIIISPGNHEGVRLMEPQPLYDEKYAWPLYNMENIILTGNPAQVNIGAKKGFSGFNVLTYHGFSFPFYANNIPRLMLKRAMNTPEEIMKYLLKNRHLAPTHASVQYFPLEKDPHIIRNVPDIFVAAHTHKSAVSYYNNILVISNSSWESMTPYQEKFGNEPDHCKVPIFNLKTRAIKILDFE